MSKTVTIEHHVAAAGVSGIQPLEVLTPGAIGKGTCFREAS